MKYLKESSLMATKDCGTPSTTVLIEATSCLYSSTRAWLGLFWDIWLLFGDIWLGWFWNIWVAEISFCVQVFKRAGKETLTLFFGRFLLNHSSMACTWISQANVYCGKSTNFHIIHKIFMSRIFSLDFLVKIEAWEGGYPLGSCLSDCFFVPFSYLRPHVQRERHKVIPVPLFLLPGDKIIGTIIIRQMEQLMHRI